VTTFPAFFVFRAKLLWLHDNPKSHRPGSQFHKDLPERIRKYLNARGIPDEMIDLNLIGWNGWRITIPKRTEADGRVLLMF